MAHLRTGAFSGPKGEWNASWLLTGPKCLDSRAGWTGSDVKGLWWAPTWLRDDLFGTFTSSLTEPAFVKHSLYLGQCSIWRMQCPVTQNRGVTFQELAVWWGSRQCEERQKLFCCTGKGTHLVLSFSSRKWEKIQVSPHGLINKWYVSNNKKSPV